MQKDRHKSFEWLAVLMEQNEADSQALADYHKEPIVSLGDGSVGEMK